MEVTPEETQGASPSTTQGSRRVLETDEPQVATPTHAPESQPVPTYETPHKPLTPKQRKLLKAKVEDRTISQDEYNRLQWDRRFANRRATGVRRFWASERNRLLEGKPGTRNWTDEQKADILANRVPKQDGRPIEGHHKYNALDHPHIANNGENIYPASWPEHFERWHGGNFRNDTFGNPLNPLYPEEF
jgi:GHH signature containing HNH/Endo VII superfamily nuclease toxin